jgi:PIN domain
MLITPAPGASREQLQKILQEQHVAVLNLQGTHQSSAQGWLGAYLEWTANAVQHLASQISLADLDRLVLTPGYSRLLAAFGTVTGVDIVSQRALRALISLELQQRVAAFEAARRALDEQVARWSRLGAFVIADTSVYIEHDDKLEALDLAGIVDAEDELAPVHLLVPIVVVDELDGLKNKADKPYKRWRAGYTLGVFDRIFPKGSGTAVLRAGKPPRPVEISAEIVFDPPTHVRLPINDDELVDRTLAIQSLAGRTVTLLTFDTHQSTRARAAGLTVIKLTKPIGDEPERR